MDVIVLMRLLLVLLKQVEGKVGQALLFDGADEFLLGDDVSTRCLGDLQSCHHGLTVSMWIQFTALQNRAPVLDTGYKGLRVLHDNNQLTVSATAGGRYWTVSVFFIIVIVSF